MTLGVVRKSNPTVRAVHIDKPLTNISIAYIQSAATYIAEKVFPRVPVAKQSDRWFVYDKRDWFRNEATVRPPSTETAGSGYNLSTDSYFCEVYGFHKDIDDRVMANFDNPLSPRRDAAEWVTQILLIHRDVAFANTFFDSGIWGETPGDNDWDGAAADFVQWDDFANSDPIGDVRSRVRAVQLLSGFKPNKLTISGPVWDALRDHPDIIERIKYTRDAVNITPTLVANVFDLDEIVIAEGIYNVAEEGAVLDMEGIFGNHALLTYTPARPSLLHPSAGYTFTWTGYGGANAYGISLDSFYRRNVKSTRVEGELAYDQNIVSGEMAWFFENAIS